MENVSNGNAQVENLDNGIIDSKLTPERARSILLANGMEVNLEQAAAILSFLRRLASICNSNHTLDG